VQIDEVNFLEALGLGSRYTSQSHGATRGFGQATFRLASGPTPKEQTSVKINATLFTGPFAGSTDDVFNEQVQNWFRLLFNEVWPHFKSVSHLKLSDFIRCR
jgi:hypothetical protein